MFRRASEIAVCVRAYRNRELLSSRNAINADLCYPSGEGMKIPSCIIVRYNIMSVASSKVPNRKVARDEHSRSKTRAVLFLFFFSFLLVPKGGLEFL